MQTARTNGTGNVQVGFEPGFLMNDDDRFSPTLNVAARYGISEGVDLGLRVGTSGYEIQSKFMITDPQDMESIALSVAPSFVGTTHGLGGDYFFGARIPILFGIPINGDELTLAARLSPFYASGTSGDEFGRGADSVFALQIGGSLGYAFRMNEYVTLIPELSFTRSLVGERISSAQLESSESTAGSDIDRDYIHLGLGILFGGRSENKF